MGSKICNISGKMATVSTISPDSPTENQAKSLRDRQLALQSLIIGVNEKYFLGSGFKDKQNHQKRSHAKLLATSVKTLFLRMETTEWIQKFHGLRLN